MYRYIVLLNGLLVSVMVVLHKLFAKMRDQKFSSSKSTILPLSASPNAKSRSSGSGQKIDDKASTTTERGENEMEYHMPNSFFDAYDDFEEEVELWIELCSTSEGSQLSPYAGPPTARWWAGKKQVLDSFGIEDAGAGCGFWSQGSGSEWLYFRAKDGFYLADRRLLKALRIAEDLETMRTIMLGGIKASAIGDDEWRYAKGPCKPFVWMR